MAFPNGWSRKGAIVLPATAETLLNFQQHLDAACFAAEVLDTASANKAAADGRDLRFTADAAGTTELPFWVERWVQDAVLGNRRADVWVKIPTRTLATATTIYAWWGNAAATMPAVTDPNGRNAVWDSALEGHWQTDSTSAIVNANGGTAATIEGAPTTTENSPVGLAVALDGVNDAIHVGNLVSNDGLIEIVVKLGTTADHVVASMDISGSARMTMRSFQSKRVAYMDTDGGGVYKYTFQDTGFSQTANYEYWAVRWRSVAGGTVVSRALPATEQTHQAWCNNGTSMYSIGGSITVGGTVLATMQAYNAGANTWAVLTPMPVGAAGGCAVYYNGKVYHFGGLQAGSVASQRTDIYDEAGNSWSAGAAMPASLVASNNQGQRAALSDANTILVFQGQKLEEYDPVANTWTARADCPASTGSYASLFFHGGYLYVLGGAGGTGEGVHRWHRATNTWTIFFGNVPYAGWAHVCEPIGDGTWLVGFGRPGGGNEQISALYRYNPATNVWTQRTSYELPTNALASAFIGNKLYMYGAWVIGRAETYSTGHHACYDYPSDVWETKPPLMEFNADGVSAAGSIETAALTNNAAKLYIGRVDGGSTYSAPKIALIRRHTSARTKQWLAESRKTMMAASTVAVPGAAVTPIFADAALLVDATPQLSASGSIAQVIQANAALVVDAVPVLQATGQVGQTIAADAALQVPSSVALAAAIVVSGASGGEQIDVTPTLTLQAQPLLSASILVGSTDELVPTLTDGRRFIKAGRRPADNKLAPLDVAEVDNLTADFSNVFSPTDPIVDIVVTCEDRVGDDPAVRPLLYGVWQLDVLKVRQRITGARGLAGVTYLLRVEALTQSGRKAVAAAFLRVTRMA